MIKVKNMKGFSGRIPLQEQNEIATCVQLWLGATIRDIVENAIASRNNSHRSTLPCRAQRIWADWLQLRNHTRISNTARVLQGPSIGMTGGAVPVRGEKIYARLVEHAKTLSPIHELAHEPVK